MEQLTFFEDKKRYNEVTELIWLLIRAGESGFLKLEMIGKAISMAKKMSKDFKKV